MDAMEAILSRRSIRRYTDKPVPEEVITELQKMRIGISAIAVEEEGILSQQKVLVVGNKVDADANQKHYASLKNKYGERLLVLPVSAAVGTGLEELKRQVWRMLDIIRVYTKAPGGKPDFEDPIVLKAGSNLEDAAAEVHKDFVRNLKYARIWGSGKHDGVMARRDHVMQDGDIIELHV